MNPLFVVLRYLYPLCCVFVPCGVYQLCLYRRYRPIKPFSKGNLLWRYVFMLYLFMVMRVVGMGSLWDIAVNGFSINPRQINLVPFASEAVMTYLLNIVLFIPLGFLLPLLWRRPRSFFYTLSAGFLFSLAIELGQLFNHRLTDIDDILMNTLGTLCGFGLWSLFHGRFPREPKGAGIFPDQPLSYIALTVLGNFLFYSWRLTLLFYGGIIR